MLKRECAKVLKTMWMAYGQKPKFGTWGEKKMYGKTTIGMIYGQNPKYQNNGCLGAKSRIGMCQTHKVGSYSL